MNHAFGARSAPERWRGMALDRAQRLRGARAEACEAALASKPWGGSVWSARRRSGGAGLPAGVAAFGAAVLAMRSPSLERPLCTRSAAET